jgi:photosynthetic reaction center cytochrome c subunit
MHRLCAVLLALAVVLPAGRLEAADRDAALATIDAAVKAQGGADALAKAQSVIRTATGVTSAGDKEAPFTDEFVTALPDRFRLTLDIGAGAQKARIILVVNGDKGWQSTGGMVAEIGKTRLEELREEAYANWVATLTPLQKDKDFDLTPLPEEKLNGQAVLGVKVAHKGHADVTLYFDKGSGLLIRLVRQAKEAGAAFEQQFVYADYKEFDGVKLPTKQTESRGGKKFTELSGIAYKFPKVLDESAFSKP